MELLRTRTRRGEIRPIYADLDKQNLEFASMLIHLHQNSIGKRKKDLLCEISKSESSFDYRFVRGLTTILQRLCNFEVEATTDPIALRRLIFKLTSGMGLASTLDARSKVLSDVAEQLGIQPQQADDSLYADLEDELILKTFNHIDEVELLKRYNLSLTQTLLFRSTFVELTVSDHWKEILRGIKFLGLMYTAESTEGIFRITIDGPLSILKLTQRYGTNIAKLLPLVVQAHKWRLSASIIRTGQFGKRILKLSINSEELEGRVSSTRAENGAALFDSAVEERFYNSFQSLNSGWKITREPTPLIVGTHVLIPDFIFERYGIRVYMEIAGFWTKRYMENKIRKLEQLKDVDFIVAASEKLLCDRLKRFKGEVIFYDNKVPLRPILDILKKREKTILQHQLESLDFRDLSLKEETVNLREMAEKLGVYYEALQQKLKESRIDGYELAGDLLVSHEKLKMLELKIDSMGDLSLSRIVHLLENEGIEKPLDLLSALNYGVNWNGLDWGKSRVYKRNVSRERARD